MKFTIERDRLNNAVKKAGSVISARPTVSIMGHFLLDVQANHLVITATGLDQMITLTLEANVEQEGKATVSAKILSQLVQRLPNGDVSVSLDERGMVNVVCARNSFSLQSLDPLQFPIEGREESRREFMISTSQLCGNIAKCSYAVSTEEAKAPMTGLLLTITDGTFTTVATDGRRMALVETVIGSDNSLDSDSILPLKAAQELPKVLEGSSDVKVSLGDTHAVFSTDDVVFQTKLLEGNFPNYRMVMPPGFENHVTMPRDEFYSALDRVSQILDKNPAVKLSLTPTEVLISAMNNAEVAESPIPASYEGENLDLSFNASFLIDPLRHLECNKLTLRFNDRLSPTGLYGDEGFLYVIMPLRHN
jgi:DNA polymerase III subunit beta